MCAQNLDSEQKRLKDPKWRQWGPYISERQWGTVREDYSQDGSAWAYFPHDIARSRAYRWGEDGIGGICDDKQILCLSFGFWNYKDPIIKERLFGLTGNEGNHGEDVKESYYYLDNTPTHSYMRILYKYPQCEFPYKRLLDENRNRDKLQPEFELVDAGAFDQDRYFDCEIEYAKAGPNDLLIKLNITNRSQEPSKIVVIPQLFFRNTWIWDGLLDRPNMRVSGDSIVASEKTLGKYRLQFEGQPELLFCENETNTCRLYGSDEKGKYYKDGINDYIVNGDQSAINRNLTGTKVGLAFRLDLAPRQSCSLRLRLNADEDFSTSKEAFGNFDNLLSQSKADADAFYRSIQNNIPDSDHRLVQRQALAGMLWSKQFYCYDVTTWLNGDKAQPPPPPSRKEARNAEWTHLCNGDVISMPDKWEYPWYAAWDLAFHCIPLSLVDPDFAKRQLLLLTHEWYLHPNGQIPAYEWNFSDVNPPVHAWATWRVYKIDKKSNGGKGDRDFLERVFQKLLLNFTWWVNRKDEHSHNIFQGGFLGLDNIGVFDRSAELPTGGHLEQSDATAWVGMYCLNLMRIALELSIENPVYQDLATKFFEHFLLIARAMVNIGGDGVQLWNEEDGFYYDVLHLGIGSFMPLKIRSFVGIIPLFAVEVLEPELLEKVPEFAKRLEYTLENKPELAELVSRWQVPGKGERRLLSLVRGHRMKRILRRVLDEQEFLSPYGVRAISKYHEQNPYVLETNGKVFTVKYLPGESDSGLFGGNSNWRGPIWMPVNYLLVESLQKFHRYYGDDFLVECPVGSQQMLTIKQISEEISKRLCAIFLKDNEGKRPVFSQYPRIQNDEYFNDYILFHEYFHGDSGRGVGASHQTGWTGLVAKLLMPDRL